MWGATSHILEFNTRTACKSRTFFLWFTEPDNKTGCRYLVVDAYNAEIPLSYYRKNGFTQLFSTEEQEKEYRNISSEGTLTTRLMFFDLIRMI